MPAGYFVAPMKTYNGFVGLRVITKNEDETSVSKALAYLKLIRIYSLSKAAAPPQSNSVDMSNIVWDAVARFDDGFYRSLARMIGEEPVQPRDAEMVGMLRTFGIDKRQGVQARRANPCCAESRGAGGACVVHGAACDLR